MKKCLTAFLICSMILSLIACSAKEDEAMNNNPVTPSNTEKPSGLPEENPSSDPPEETPSSDLPEETTEPTAIPGQNAVPEPTELQDYNTVPETTSVPEPSPNAVPASISEEDYTGKKLVALTFDDGPNLQTTPLVLDKLEEHGVVATFFLIGKFITDNTKPVMERELELGCEINNHSWTHSNMSTMTQDQIKEEIQKTSDIIKDMVGVTPAFFRPPFISTSDEMYQSIDLPFICGINCVDWDASVASEKRVETILNTVKDGDIILLHDFTGNTNTVNALDGIIQGLKDDGYAMVTLSKLFELKGVDPNVKNKIWTNTAW